MVTTWSRSQVFTPNVGAPSPTDPLNSGEERRATPGRKVEHAIPDRHLGRLHKPPRGMSGTKRGGPGVP